MADGRPARILVVCTANICRSPMAERLLAEYFARESPPRDVFVSSAGTIARPGQPAARGMQVVAESWGLDLDYHRSRRIDRELVLSQDLIITMEGEHRSRVSRLAPGVAQRTFLITELAELVSDGRHAASELGLAESVERWSTGRAHRRVPAEDVADPYGRSAQHYLETAWQLADLVEQLGEALSPRL